MKKIIGLLSAILICYIAFFSINYWGEPNYNDISAERFQRAQTPQQLIDESDLIVHATVLPDKKNVTVSSPDGQFLLFGYTETTLDVIDVYKGTLPSRNIIITEEYFTTTNITGEKNIWTDGNYMPANKNKEYLFFLKAYEGAERYEGMYYPIDLEYGKYVIPNEEIKLIIDHSKGTNLSKSVVSERFEIQTKTDYSKYIEWYDFLTQEYINK